MSEHVKYVAGFLFDKEFNKVVLVKKNRPAWQKGFFNGVGGHVEAGESSLMAMRREFSEETGMQIDTWQQFCTLSGSNWTVEFYWSTGSISVKSMTDEEICVFELHELHELNVISNIRWLVPMAVDSARTKGFAPVTIRYKTQAEQYLQQKNFIDNGMQKSFDDESGYPKTLFSDGSFVIHYGRPVGDAPFNSSGNILHDE